MRGWLVVAIVGAARVAAAAATCPAASGTAMLAIEVRSDAPPGEQPAPPTSTLELYDNGAIASLTARGREQIRKTGCLDAATLKKIRAALAAARWRTVRCTGCATCKRYSTEYSVIRWKGRVVFTQRVCSKDGLDEASQRALDDALEAIARVRLTAR